MKERFTNLRESLKHSRLGMPEAVLLVFVVLWAVGVIVTFLILVIYALIVSTDQTLFIAGVFIAIFGAIYGLARLLLRWVYEDKHSKRAKKVG